MLNRRAFLGTLIGGTVAAAAVHTWPFRVFSFPSQIATPKIWVSPEALTMLHRHMDDWNERRYVITAMSQIAKDMDIMAEFNHADFGTPGWQIEMLNTQILNRIDGRPLT